MKEEQIYVLTSVVHRNASEANFPLKFSDTVTQDDANLECLSVYATPLAFEPYDEDLLALTRKWSLTGTLKYLGPATQTVDLGVKGEAEEKLASLASNLKKKIERLNKSVYSFHQEELGYKFEASGPTSFLKLPPGWFAEFSSKSLASVFGLHETPAAEALTYETSAGSFVLKNKSASSPSLIRVPINLLKKVSIQQIRGTALTVTFGPTETFRTVSYSAVRPKTSGTSSGDVKKWLSHALKEILGGLDLKSNLVACIPNSQGITFLANQDLPHQPIILEFYKDKALSSDLHSDEIDQTVLHFNLKPFEAATAGARHEGVFASWGTTATKGKVVWTDPLRKIAPFYLLAEGQEGSSLMSKSFVSVAAFVGKNLQVKERACLKIKTRQNQLCLRFVDSYLEECVFSTPFNVFLVCRVF